MKLVLINGSQSGAPALPKAKQTKVLDLTTGKRTNLDFGRSDRSGDVPATHSTRQSMLRDAEGVGDNNGLAGKYGQG
jgi:hypothetical protein